MSRLAALRYRAARLVGGTRATRAYWPHVPGHYVLVDAAGSVVVALPGRTPLARAVARDAPPGLCLVAELDNENIAIERLVGNLLGNPAITAMICAGGSSEEDPIAGTLAALFRSGLDTHGRVVGAPGAYPLLADTRAADVEALRGRIRFVDMRGCADVADMHGRIRELAAAAEQRAAVAAGRNDTDAPKTERVVIETLNEAELKADKAGYFEISVEYGAILLKHYSPKKKLLRVIEGKDARAICRNLIRRGWVSRLDHAAYLGRELTRAERAIRDGAEYRQDFG